MATIRVTIEGLDTLKRALGSVERGAPAALARALRVEAEQIATEAKRRTPVLTGALRSSIHTEQDENGIAIVAGGPAASYALIVHEDLEAHHTVGRAKFLESAALDAASGMEARLARHVINALLRG